MELTGKWASSPLLLYARWEPGAPRLVFKIWASSLKPCISVCLTTLYTPPRITSVFVGSVLSLVFSETYIVKPVYTEPPWDQLLRSE